MAKIESYSQLESGALVPCVKLIDTNTEKVSFTLLIHS